MSQNIINWYKECLAKTLEEIKGVDNKELIGFLEDKLKELTRADTLYLLTKETQEGEYFIPASSKLIQICQKNSLFHEAIKKRHPVVVNDCRKSMLFDESCDTLSEEAPSNLFIIPVYYEMHDDMPLVMIWGAQNRRDESLDQKNILYATKFIDTLKVYLFEIITDIGTYPSQVPEQVEELLRHQERAYRYFDHLIRDIRTPMNAVMGILGLIAKSDQIDETVKGYANTAVKSMDQMVHLVNDALNFARILKEDYTIEQEPFCPDREFFDFIRTYYHIALKKGIRFTLFVDPMLPERIISDRYRIKQVVTSILSNAIKYNVEQGSVRVEVLYEKSEDHLRIVVFNTDMGIPEEKKKYLFAKKGVTDYDISDESGLEVGLGMAHQITTLLEGKIDYESEEGAGTTFSVTLPANTPSDAQPRLLPKKKWSKHRLYLYQPEGMQSKEPPSACLKYFDAWGIDYLIGNGDLKEIDPYDILAIEKTGFDSNGRSLVQKFIDLGKRVVLFADESDDFLDMSDGDLRKVFYPICSRELYDALDISEKETEKAKEKKEEYQSLSFKGKKVVVVDDNKINLKVMKHILQRLDTDVVSFEEAKSAVSYLRKEKTDLLIIDENMPEMSGSEAIKIIRKECKKNKEIPIVSLTGDIYHREEILESGANRVIFKPIKIDVISDILSKYMN
jgi:signal transduction histidine kinase